MTDSQSNPTVVIIGAGIIGLTTALKLQAHLPPSSTDILLVAKEWPTSIPGAPPSHSVDYASMWAGAHVRPIPASTPQLTREAAWLKTTCTEFARQVEKEPSIGVTSTKGVEFLDNPPENYAAQTKERFETETGLVGYRRYNDEDLPRGAKLGYEYSTYCINAPVYCANLLRKFIARGGRTMQRDLRTEWEAFILRDDVKMNQDGSWSFIIPRFFDGGTIMGGTKEPGSWHAEPNAAQRAKLLKGGHALTKYATDEAVRAPQDVKVIADVVGRRPTRDGGVRIQVEEKRLTGTYGELKTGHVVHAYGAGGRGFEISWGVAEEVSQLASRGFQDLVGTKAKL
ncbi:D-amino-acid oxidase-like protein [Emericellopsis cladophorae]|uniref:D-amino-acid oxidase-like protein n=1 Tax=Emericellopsis cladophorae TaxID=2686198 RepID=A0A9P9XZZ5_9HYPO|nr:D-amino-acid oxidase-like protein [Emericellopsis cladophorae]KAI6780668.1 D-amino-acid oxidase-like protein [Emericellopsis cladophorae]